MKFGKRSPVMVIGKRVLKNGRIGFVQDDQASFQQESTVTVLLVVENMRRAPFYVELKEYERVGE